MIRLSILDFKHSQTVLIKSELNYVKEITLIRTKNFLIATFNVEECSGTPLVSLLFLIIKTVNYCVFNKY